MTEFVKGEVRRFATGRSYMVPVDTFGNELRPYGPHEHSWHSGSYAAKAVQEFVDRMWDGDKWVDLGPTTDDRARS